MFYWIQFATILLRIFVTIFMRECTLIISVSFQYQGNVTHSYLGNVLSSFIIIIFLKKFV